MGRLRFILLSGLVLFLFIALGLAATAIFIDAADFVSDWSPAEQARRLIEMSVVAAALIAPLAMILFARRLIALGWSAGWALPIYGLVLAPLLIEWAFPNDPRTALAWLPFGAAFIGLIFGDLKFGLFQRNAGA
jgi:Mn2+/Fe2+ NRAMP family transporter